MDTRHLTPSALGYFVFNATNLEAWKTFAIDLIGMQPGGTSDTKTLALRLDNQTQRVVIEQSDNDDLVAVGWEMDSEEALEALVAHIDAQGVPVQLADRALTQQRQVEKLYCCTDPNQVTHELYFGPTTVPLSNAFRSSVLQGKFVADRLGAGHYVAIGQDADATRQFYRETLCLRLSDYIRGEVAPGGPILDATFMHTRTGRHHSAAFAAIPFPKKLHHFMVEVADMNDVGLAFQRCKDAGVPFMQELGHHPNDQMFSFYVQTPGGFGLEVGWGGIIIDDHNWEVKSYSQLSDWGHHPPRQ